MMACTPGARAIASAVSLTSMLRGPVGAPYGKAVVSMEMDDAARAKQGLAVLPGLSGPIGMRITAPLGAPDPVKAQIDLDLTRAEIDGLGIVKAAGRPGKASFELSANDDHTTTLDQLVVDAGGASIKGSVKIGTPDDPSQFSAHLTQVKLSPGDDAKVDLSKAADTVKVVIHAASFDGRPFLKTLTLTHAEDSRDRRSSVSRDERQTGGASPGKDDDRSQHRCRDEG